MSGRSRRQSEQQPMITIFAESGNYALVPTIWKERVTPLQHLQSTTNSSLPLFHGLSCTPLHASLTACARLDTAIMMQTISRASAPSL
jgi:hypothetical protein